MNKLHMHLFCFSKKHLHLRHLTHHKKWWITKFPSWNTWTHTYIQFFNQLNDISHQTLFVRFTSLNTVWKFVLFFPKKCDFYPMHADVLLCKMWFRAVINANKCGKNVDKHVFSVQATPSSAYPSYASTFSKPNCKLCIIDFHWQRSD